MHKRMRMDAALAAFSAGGTHCERFHQHGARARHDVVQTKVLTGMRGHISDGGAS